MQRIVPKILIGILVSFYMFPVEFQFLPGVNSKMMLAALGLAVFCFRAVREREKIQKSIISSCMFAFLFSLICLYATSRTQIYDYAYAKYFISFFVWTFGAYGVCNFIRKEFGSVSIQIIVYYLAIVCVFQCAMAQLIDKFSVIRNVVDTIFQQGQEGLRGINRLYGIGASLDNAGVRFACCLILISYIIADNIDNYIRQKELIFLGVSLIIITVYGNMISRTTTVGVLMGLAYIAYTGLKNTSFNIRKNSIVSWIIIGALVLGAIYLFSYLYRTDSAFRYNMRFAFEGFFNWVETGTFRTGSTDKLNNTMWIWPEDTETWLIGTGKFDNWAFGTDIGYCRFILYCGLIGFGSFVIFFIHNTVALSKYYDNFTVIALMIFITGLIVWIKVSTDIYQIYALLLCADGIIRDEELEEEEAKE